MSRHVPKEKRIFNVLTSKQISEFAAAFGISKTRVKKFSYEYILKHIPDAIYAWQGRLLYFPADEIVCNRQIKILKKYQKILEIYFKG